MFGGVAFMVRGNMTVGITNKGDFMARFDGARHDEVSRWPGAKPMTFGKGDMKGFLFVDAEMVSRKAALDKWIRLALAYNAALPAKGAKTVKGAKRPATKAAVTSKSGKKSG